MKEKGVSSIVVIVIGIIIAAAAGSAYVITRGGGYPTVSISSVAVGNLDNEIRIYVLSGSIASGEWAYSVSATEGSYTWVIGTEPLDPVSVSLGTYDAGTWYVSLKHIDTGHIYFDDEPVTISVEVYPAIAATALSIDNEIVLNVLTGSIATGEWAYSVSATEGSYSWTTGTEALDAPSVSLGSYAAGTWYVNVKHLDSGHIYFTTDQSVTIFGGAVPPSATLNVTAKFNSDDNTVTLTITHQGGDSLVVSDLRLIADKGTTSLYDADLNLDNDNITTLTVGHSYPLDNFDAGGATSGSTISVKLIHKPSNQQIYSKSNVSVT